MNTSFLGIRLDQFVGLGFTLAFSQGFKLGFWLEFRQRFKLGYC